MVIRAKHIGVRSKYLLFDSWFAMASVMVTLSDGKKAKIIFVPCDKKRGWLALLSTHIDVTDEDMIRLYSKRWDIEVFFNMCKQHLKLLKAVQLRSDDGLIGCVLTPKMRSNLGPLFNLNRM